MPYTFTYSTQRIEYDDGRVSVAPAPDSYLSRRLRSAFPPGSTVYTVTRAARRFRPGVMVFRNRREEYSGWVAELLGRIQNGAGQIAVPRAALSHAATALVGDLAEALYGDRTALRQRGISAPLSYLS